MRTGALPSSRAALYHEVIDAILETREKDSIRRKMLYRVGADLALRLYQLKGRIFTRNDLLDVLPEVRKDQQENWDTEEMAARMVTSGMLEVVAHETYGFRHQTIQEYLAAVELARRLVSQEPATCEQAWNLVWSKRTYSRWTEVLRLLVGILVQEHGKTGAQEAQRWLRALIEQQTIVDGDLGDLGLALALKSLGEVAEVTADWKETGGMELETEIEAIWVDGLLETFGHNRMMRRERLQALTREVSGLSALVMGRVTSRLVDALSDCDSRVRAAAIQTLAELGESVLANHLKEALDDPHEYVRAVAVQVLGERGADAPVEPILKALDDPHEYVRAAAAQALGMLGERMPVEPLLKALDDPYEYVRGAAAQALGMLGERMPVEPLLKALDDPYEYVRGAAAQALGMLGERMPVEPLLKALDDPHEYVRAAAAQALGMLGEHMPVESILKALDDPHEYVRAAAAQALGELGASAPIERLVAVLDDLDEHVRTAAALTLGKLKAFESVEQLVSVLNDAFGPIYATAAYVLGELGAHAPIEPLLSTLDDTHEYVRVAAVQALGKLGASESTDRLVRALHDGDWRVRVAVVQALGKLESPMPAGSLMEAVHDTAEGRHAALYVLGEMGERPPVETLDDEHRYVSAAANQILGKLRAHIPMKSLTNALNDEDQRIRVSRITSIRQVRNAYVGRYPKR